MGESFFGKQYDIPAGMNSRDFRNGLSAWQEKQKEKNQDKERSEQYNTGEMLLITKNLIQSIRLQRDYENEQNERELQIRKEQALKLLDELMNKYVSEYSAWVNRFNKSNIFSDIERDKEEFMRIDASRRLAHNALMTQIQVTLRYIREQFSTRSPDDLEDLEERKSMEGTSLLPIERVQFPCAEKIFLPKYADLNNRESITQWVKDIRESMSRMKS